MDALDGLGEGSDVGETDAASNSVLIAGVDPSCRGDVYNGEYKAVGKTYDSRQYFLKRGSENKSGKLFRIHFLTSFFTSTVRDGGFPLRVLQPCYQTTAI